jgi:hypothetical protein
MGRVFVSSFAIGVSVALGACGAQAPGEAASNNVVAVEQAPVAATGLSPAEETAVKQSARAFLLARSWGRLTGPPRPCSDVFSVGEPRLLDTSLGPQSGLIKIVAPITAENPVPSSWYGKRGLIPWEDCYAISDGGWPRGQAVDVTLNLRVERWASGWRVAAVQG